MVNLIQVTKLVVRINEEDPSSADYQVEYILTDSPEITNYLDPYTSHMSTPIPIETFPGWPDGIDFT